VKTFISAFLITAVLGVQAYPECTYFRTSVNLLKCAEADAATLKADNPYLPPSDDPALDESGAQAFVRVDCECQYSLTGSNVLCDMEETVEKSSVIGTDKPAETCLRGRMLCKEICPPRLP
jgi:hypothetical protein